MAKRRSGKRSRSASGGSPKRSGSRPVRSTPEDLAAERAHAADALVKLRSGGVAPGTLLPSDHVRLLVELLRPLTPELARRWLSALLLVPGEERSAVVARVERAIVDAYSGTSSLAEPIDPRGAREHPIDLPAIPPDDRAEERQVHVVYPPRQREGFVEQVVRTYQRQGDAPDGPSDVQLAEPESMKPGSTNRQRQRRAGG